MMQPRKLKERESHDTRVITKKWGECLRENERYKNREENEKSTIEENNRK